MRHIWFIVYLLAFASINSAASEIKVKFHFKFGFVKGGEGTMTITDTTYNGKPAINYHVVGQTTGLAQKIYNVYDVYQTIVDAETLLPLKAIRDVKEGSYERYNETFFYHDKDSLYSERTGWKEMPENTVDILSVFFYFINKNPFENMQPGDAVIYPTYSAEKIRDISIKYLRDEELKTKLGRFDTHILKPSVKSKILNKSDGIKCHLAKATKVPIYAELDLTVGALKAVLRSYTIDGVEQNIE